MTTPGEQLDWYSQESERLAQKAIQHRRRAERHLRHAYWCSVVSFVAWIVAMACIVWGLLT